MPEQAKNIVVMNAEADVQAINDHQYIRESPLTVNSGCNLADKGFRVKLPNGYHDPCLIPLFQRNLIFEDLFDFFGGERQAEVLLRQPWYHSCRRFLVMFMCSDPPVCVKGR